MVPSLPSQPQLDKGGSIDMAVRRRTRTRAPPAPLQWQETTSIVDKYWGEMTSEAILYRCLENAPRNPWHTHRVFRKLYLLFFLVFGFFVLVPLWAMWYWPVWNRPRRSWTLKRCLRVRWSRRLCALVARCEIDWLGRDLSEELDPAKLVYSHPVMLERAPDSWLLGYAATAMDQLNATRGKWHPEMIHRRSTAWGRWNPSPSTHGFTRVPGFWYSGRKASPHAKPPPRVAGEAVMLAFHGGGYICGTAAESDATSLIYRNLVEYTPISHVLSVDYRLANTAPWPLPLLDAISAYYHLVAVEGVDERDILVGGDSAGGHLSLALMRWIRDAGVNLGLRGPRALLLFSPWSDIGFTHVWGDKALAHNWNSDVIHDTFGPFASGLLTRAMAPGAIHSDIYLSPASRLIAPQAGMFVDFPPVFVTMGEAERISPEITSLFARFQLARSLHSPPVPDVLHKAKDAVHDFMIFPWFAEESAVVLSRLDRWLRDLLALEIDNEDAYADSVGVEGVGVQGGDDTPLALLAGRDDAQTEMDERAAAAGLTPLAMISPAMELPPPLAPLSEPKKSKKTPKSPFLSPLSPFSPLSPAQTPASPYVHPLSPEARQRRHDQRVKLKAAKSPTMVPARDTPRLMYADMRDEGLHLLDIPVLDLGSVLSPRAASASLDEVVDELDLDLEEGSNGYARSKASSGNGHAGPVRYHDDGHAHVHWAAGESSQGTSTSAQHHSRPNLGRRKSAPGGKSRM